MGLDAGHAAARHRGRHGLPRFVHQRPDRGPARRRRRAAGPQGRRRRADAGRARARCGCARRPRRRVWTRSSPTPAPNGGRRAARCAWDEPRSARARASARVDVEPQFRGPAGQGRPDPPGLAAGRGRHRGARHPLRARRSGLRTDRNAGDISMEAFTTHTGIGVPLRRSNVDTDQIIPAVYLKRVTRTGFEDGLFAAWRNDPSVRSEPPPFDRGSVLVAGPGLRHRLLARARGVGAVRLRIPGRDLVPLRRHLPRQRRQGRTAGRSGAPRRTSNCSGSCSRQQPGLELTVDLENKTVTAGTTRGARSRLTTTPGGVCSRVSTTSD